LIFVLKRVPEGFLCPLISRGGLLLLIWLLIIITGVTAKEISIIIDSLMPLLNGFLEFLTQSLESSMLYARGI
jgi:hypothetical protein